MAPWNRGCAFRLELRAATHTGLVLAGLIAVFSVPIGIAPAEAQPPTDNPMTRGTPSLQPAEPATWLSPCPDADPRCFPIQYEEVLAPPAAPEINRPLSMPTERGPDAVVPIPLPPVSPYSWKVDALARGYYRNDQRIAWSGLEETFVAEGVITARMRRQCDNWEVSLDGEFYINQPFDRNIITETQEQVSYLGNYRVDTFEISKLSISCRRDDFTLTVGKMETPFGRTYFPLYTNARIDAPYIRTESILWRETGFLLHYQPGILVADVAMTNGSENLDTNSSKAFISRVGLQQGSWAMGVSAKCQDGIGSETQKEFKNHAGADAMIRWGRFQLSGEFIYDEYGLRHPWFNPNDIFWQHSIYYRDLNLRNGVPLSGVGYYVNLGYCLERWDINLNYGDFYPVAIGNPQHDEVNHRGIVKCCYHRTQCLGLYGCVLVENSGWIAQLGEPRQGYLILGGLQYTF
jgi:hypothetical protein